MRRHIVDLNSNMSCDIMPTEAWRIQVSNVQTHLTVVVGPNEQPSNLGCSGFPN